MATNPSMATEVLVALAGHDLAVQIGQDQAMVQVAPRPHKVVIQDHNVSKAKARSKRSRERAPALVQRVSVPAIRWM